MASGVEVAGGSGEVLAGVETGDVAVMAPVPVMAGVSSGGGVG